MCLATFIAKDVDMSGLLSGSQEPQNLSARSARACVVAESLMCCLRLTHRAGLVWPVETNCSIFYEIAFIALAVESSGTTEKSHDNSPRSLHHEVGHYIRL